MNEATIKPVQRRILDLRRTVYAVSCGPCKWHREAGDARQAEALRQRHECKADA